MGEIAEWMLEQEMFGESEFIDFEPRSRNRKMPRLMAPVYDYLKRWVYSPAGRECDFILNYNANHSLMRHYANEVLNVEIQSNNHLYTMVSNNLKGFGRYINKLNRAGQLAYKAKNITRNRDSSK